MNRLLYSLLFLILASPFGNQLRSEQARNDKAARSGELFETIARLDSAMSTPSTGTMLAVWCPC